MGRKAFVSLVLVFLLVLTSSMPLGAPTAVALTSDRLDPAVVVAVTAGEKSLSVIVQGNGDIEALKQAITRLGGRVETDFWIIDSVLATLSPDALTELAKDPAVRYISLNHSTRVSEAPYPVTPTSDNSPPDEETVHDVDVKQGLLSVRYPHPLDLGIDQVHAQNVLGRGVTIAFLDTGLSTQGTLEKMIKAGFEDRFVGQVNFLQGKPKLKKEGKDANGHGTHVTGLVWNAFRDRDSGTFMGSAPGARILMLQVLDENGQGKYEDDIEAIQWAVEHKNEYNIRVMNISLYAEVASPYWADPLDRAVEAAWRAGIVVVAAAGNGGPNPMTVAVPGNDPYVITVGALDGKETAGYLADDTLAVYSAAGPTYDLFVKPDVVAPGHKLVSFLAPDSKFARERADRKRGEHWFVMNGTSVATPLVSGVVALMLERNPGLTPDQVKYRLIASAATALDPATNEPIYSVWQQGAGRVWAPGAVFGDLPGTANQGLNIDKDLAGEEHYQGWTTWDEATQTFRIQDSGYATWSGGYATWSGGYATWSGGYATWSGGYATWSGGYATWSGGYATWSGGYATWSGGYATWSGGYATWSGGMLGTDMAMSIGRWVPD
ncbi:MAG: S8 family serine peptidase [Anaerolineae bacterium]|jgi:subtilisin family serine protease|nr:S8 family serine peptidase [Anaerolineae bacterium]